MTDPSEHKPTQLKGLGAASNLLKQGRKRKGLTQQEMAEALGIGRTTYNGMEGDTDVLAGASFLTVLKAFRLVGYDITLNHEQDAKNIEDINKANKEKRQSSLPKI